MKITVLGLNYMDNKENISKLNGKKYIMDRFSCKDEEEKVYSQCSYFNYSGSRIKVGDILDGDITEDKLYKGEMTYNYKKAKVPFMGFGGGKGVSKDDLVDVSNALSDIAFSNIFSAIFPYYIDKLNKIKETITDEAKKKEFKRNELDFIIKKAKLILNKE